MLFGDVLDRPDVAPSTIGINPAARVQLALDAIAGDDSTVELKLFRGAQRVRARGCHMLAVLDLNVIEQFLAGRRSSRRVATEELVQLRRPA